VDELLDSPQREGGNQDLPAACRDPADDLAESILAGGGGLVVAIAVGGFDDQRVDGTGGRLGIPDDGEPGAADVAGEDEAVDSPLGDPEIHAGRAQNVAGLGVLEREVLADIVNPVVGQPD